VSVRRSRKRPLRDSTTDAVRQEDLDGHPLLLAVDAPISDVTEAAVAVRPGARVQRDVARQTVVSALDAFFVFQFRGRGDAWFVPVGWLGERTWRPFAIDLAHAVGRPVFALTAYDDPPTLAELPSGVEPNDVYLCIVPARSRWDRDEIHLPFEGDRQLAIILSKAFMLAADDTIRDPTIVSQIRGEPFA